MIPSLIPQQISSWMILPFKDPVVIHSLPRLNRFLTFVFVAASLLAGSSVRAQDLEKTQDAYRSGQYQKTLELTNSALDSGAWDKEWRFLKIRAALATGDYELAAKEAEIMLQERRRDLDVRWLAREAFLHAGQSERASEMIAEIDSLVGRRPWAYQNAKSLVVIGETALALGIDPKLVLERFFDVAKKLDTQEKSIFLSTGFLALRKEDYKLASETFQKGFQLYPDDPEFAYGLAKSFHQDDRDAARDFLEQVLAMNPNHIPSLLMLVENQMDAEEYTEAEKILDEIFEINPNHENAWAMKAALFHLQGMYDEEANAMEQSLSKWTDNPEPLYLIGRKLSLNYRFREGADYQRQALKLDPDYLPSINQLAQDLLRLGRESEGWNLIREARDKDPYHVTIFNLSQLRNKLDTFTELKREGIVLSMEPEEARLYGQEALDLLVEAKEFFSRKYKVTPPEVIRVEIFPEQKDFAIRTFGMPGGLGYLGVCFGPLITANSPATTAQYPANWKAVLWHEFCHTITLEKTNNRMPRWLSEGISVYEELLKDPSWGQSMDPQYRRMILEDDALTPIGELSEAFLKPETQMHLQFAYYQSALVVEYLIQERGMEPMLNLLDALGSGERIQLALEQTYGSLKDLEKKFETHAIQLAESFAPGADWTEIEDSDWPEWDAEDSVWEKWMADRPNHHESLKRFTIRALDQENWEAAEATARKMIEINPDGVGPQCGRALLSQALRGKSAVKKEIDVLREWSALDSEAVAAYRRLMDLGIETQQPQLTLEAADHFLAVDPFREEPYSQKALAYTEMGNNPAAAVELIKQLQLEPTNPSRVEYEIAWRLADTDPEQARYYLLQSLEDAPRFREGLALLLKLNSPTLPAEPGSENSQPVNSGQGEDLDSIKPEPEIGDQPNRAEPVQGMQADTDSIEEEMDEPQNNQG